MVTNYYELVLAEAMVPTRTRISADSLLALWIEFICELFEKQYMFDYTKIWDEICMWIYVRICVMAMERGAVIAWSKYMYNVILHMSR